MEFKNVFFKNSIQVPLASNNILPINQKDYVWYVKKGSIDIFLSDVSQGELTGHRTHLSRVNSTEMAFYISIPKTHRKFTILGKATPGSIIYKMPISEIISICEDTECRTLFIQKLERWIERIWDITTKSPLPSDKHILSISEEDHFETNMVIQLPAGIKWIPSISTLKLFDKHMADGSKTYFPVSEKTWFRTTGPSNIITLNTKDIINQGKLNDGLKTFHRFVLEEFMSESEKQKENELKSIRKRKAKDISIVNSSLKGLSAIFEDEEDVDKVQRSSSSDMQKVFNLVCNSMEIKIKKTPPEDKHNDNLKHQLDNLAKTANISKRKVYLGKQWWEEDHGTLIGFMKESNAPIAIIPKSSKHYHYWSPQLNRFVIIDENIAQTIQVEAFMLYRPIDMQTDSSLYGIFRFGLRGGKKDIISYLLIGGLVGILGLAIPIVTGLLFDEIIPDAERGLLFQYALALIFATVASAVFNIASSISLLRLESKMDLSLQAAIWDHLIKLPLPFFRDFTAGDLAGRANGINEIRLIISGTTINTILGTIFSLFSFSILFYFSVKLAMIATVTVLFLLAISTLSTFLLVKYQSKMIDMDGAIDGTLRQFIEGIAKIRITCSENRAFRHWGKLFTHYQEQSYRSENIENVFLMFYDIFNIFSMMIIFATIAYILGDNTLSIGEFLAFSAAYGTFLTSSLALADALLKTVKIFPTYERLKPIVTTQPEIDDSREDPGDISGKIEIDHIFFRYKSTSSYVINDLSLKIMPGEMVALVGPSGAGKSTLLRLLLGFETSTNGAIYFDDIDINRIDLRLLRYQVGVVLQNDRLFPGSIYENILGSSHLTMDDAWEAATMCGLGDDLNDMPMGMHTVISEGDGSISGGQRQRILIARAIVHKPRVLFLDEATSSLDNETQEIITSSLKRLHTTRVVIAHRISTIEHADRIYVLENGQITESGNYNELIEQGETFALLAKRQLA